MRDQAEGLRKLAAAAARPREADRSGVPVFAVGSGKGGVGKSVLSVLLAAALARQGHRVLLVDGSQNQGNLHILLGVRPAAKLGALLTGEAGPDDLVLSVAERLWLLPCDSGDDALYSLTPTDRARLHHRLSTLFDGFDAAVVDAGPGIEGVVRATIRASRLVVVCVPEPAALSDAYAAIKLAALQVPSLPAGVVVNRVTGADEALATFERLRLASERFLRRGLEFLGAVPEDDSLRLRVRTPGQLLSARASTAAETAMEDIARGLVADRAPATRTS